MAIKAFNSVGGFSVGENAANVILANGDITTSNANLSANLYVADTANIGNLRTNNLLYANGSPWDLQQAAGGNTEIQYNDGNGNFGASANFTFDQTTNLLTVTGNINSTNANLGNLVVANFYKGVFDTTSSNQSNITTVGNLTLLNVDGAANLANVLNVEGNINANTNVNVNLALTGNTANFSGNVQVDTWLMVSNTANVGNLRTDNLLYANGQPWDLQEAAGANTEIQYNEGDNFSASANFTYNDTTQVFTVNGNANITGTVLTANIDSGASNLVLTANGHTTTLYANGDANVSGNISAQYFIGNGAYITGVSASTSTALANGTSNVTIPTVNGPIEFSANGSSNVMTVSDTGLTIAGGNITTVSNANLVLDPNGSGLVVIANTSGGATAIAMGDPTQGNLVSNAVSLANSSSVSNAIAQLNTVLGKLVPPAPPNFPAGTTIAIASLSTYRVANYTQTDNTATGGKSQNGGNTISTVRRASSYTTNSITNAGPGDTGTIAVYLNGSSAGSRALTTNLDGNGTYSNLIISNNVDYHVVNANIQAGFWSVFTSSASGTVTEGWNEVYIADSTTSNTNTTVWFYDSSAPGTPVISALTIDPPVSPSYAYSSTVPHYDNTNQFAITANVNKLSGNMYPTSDTFVTGTAGGAFGAPAGVTYAAASVTTPLAQNLYVSSGNASISTTSTIISGFGASTTGPSLSSNNSYNLGTASLTATLAANVLYKTGTTSSASVIQEANIFVGSTIGSGSDPAFRIINPGSGNTPAYTGSEAAFNSQSSTLQTYDPTVVANVLKHDQTNYSTGYLPAGPDLSTGRSGTQYFTFKIQRSSVSKFDIKWSGTIAGLWVALPGSVIDTSSTLNGWLDMSIAYAGAGQPGAGTGGNGSNGASLGGVAPLNSAQTNKAVTATFGTVSSTSATNNEIYIRIALTSGQSVTALSLQTASN